MYDYGARFYMPDIGRFGTIDPRSAYTHEAYSYVWNNPIFFNDPTGMTGEAFADCPTCPKTDEYKRYRDDPNNTYVYDPKTGNVEKETQIQEVVVTGYRALKAVASTAIVSTVSASEAIWASASSALAEIGSGALTLGRWSLWALPLMLNGDSSPPKPVLIPPPPVLYTDSDDDTDVNGVNIPNEKKGGGKNAQHKNQKAKESAQGEYEKANAEYNRLKSKPNKTPQDKKDLKKAENQRNHWKKKADETGENHSQKAKGSN